MRRGITCLKILTKMKLEFLRTRGARKSGEFGKKKLKYNNNIINIFIQINI